jgi:hypothetical protein
LLSDRCIQTLSLFNQVLQMLLLFGKFLCHCFCLVLKNNRRSRTVCQAL